ncbi:motility associated factor glycosyltransferase family protein [Butyrivibrio sp. AE3006]|uniref:motility associated factor glycosyltransferase family protein n=1 Tax=Butyrivibrio sp. AE3006 TaxID=1280673 RepID=UPI000412F955|nr:6-hydroxymethylpterin diphosphokinase MptE-like protein [Butyrivibrio sp. AE3006]
MISKLRKDEGIRELNFSAFEARYGVRPKIDPGEDNKYLMDTARNGEPVLQIRGVLNGADLRLNSSYDPSYEAGRLADKQEVPKRRTTIALMGFGNGIYLRKLIDKFRLDTMFFVYEPEESLFSFVCAFIDITDIIRHNRVEFFINNEQHKAMADRMIKDLGSFKPETICLFSPFYSNNAEFDHICHELEAAMASAGDFQRERSRTALKCRMYAWNHMRNNMLLTELKGRLPSDITAIIVSAGPSLNKNVEELKKVKGHGFIMCTDRALSVLDKHGIEPDVIVSMDAEKSPDYLRADVSKNAYLLCSYQTNSETQKIFDGRCIYFHTLRYERTLFGEKAGTSVADLGGNVAGGCFVICQLLGIKNIVLIGQDLAFTGGRHHADDKDEGNPDIKKRLVPGIDGNPVETNEMWIGFRDFFERQIGMNPQLNVIDATEGGAKIEGTGIMKFSEVADILKDKTFDPKAVFDGMNKAQTDEEYTRMREIIKSWIDDLDMISKNAGALSEICSQLLKAAKYHDINDLKYSKKKKMLSDLKIEIHRTVAYSMLEHCWVRDQYSIPDMVLFLRNNEEAIPVLDSAMKFYEALPEDCRSLKKCLEESIM